MLLLHMRLAEGNAGEVNGRDVERDKDVSIQQDDNTNQTTYYGMNDVINVAVI